MKKYQTYKCNKCGNEVEVQHVGGGTLVCCGEKMECITTNLTAVNLMKAFAGESMARNKYDLFADIAQKEGYLRVAEHFREAALNEMYHARAEFKAYHMMVDGAETEITLKNLDSGMAGENYEHTIMYPEFATIAREEGLDKIAKLFEMIAKVEVEHEREYKELQDALKADGFLSSDEEEVWVCEVCGHVHRGKKAPKACPLCKVPAEHFKKEHLY